MSLVKRIKRRLRGTLKAIHAKYVRRFRSFSSEDLARVIEQAGVKAGDEVLLHASFDAAYGFRGTPSQAIDVFCNAIGQSGTLYMVSMPYGEATQDYLERGTVFDPKRTMSRMGLMSEIFRRRPGVLRSSHPTHPVLGLGPSAGVVLGGHERCVFPCGPGSPFERLLERKAKMVFLNASLSSMTYFHYLEHLVAHLLPFPIYSEMKTAGLRQENGEVVGVGVCPFTRESIRRRRPGLLQDWMREAKILSYIRIGASELHTVGMEDVTRVVLEKARSGLFFYDLD